MIPTVVLLRFSLGNAVGSVGRLQEHAVIVATCVAHVGQVHLDQPVHGAHVQGVPGLIEMKSSVIQLSTREIICVGSKQLLWLWSAINQQEAKANYEDL